MKALRLIGDQHVSARRNIALTAAMAQLHSEGIIPDTLRIYQYPESVLLGRNQDIATAADIELCHAHGVEVARRVTGGGAIYMDSGVIVWDLVLARSSALDIGLVAGHVCRAIAIALSQIGIEAYCRSENEILIGGKKVAGASGYFDGPTLVYQGSLMIAPDFEKMATILRLPSACRDLASLATATCQDTSCAEIELLLSGSIVKALNRSVAPSGISPEEKTRADFLFMQEIGTAGFVLHGESGRGEARAA